MPVILKSGETLEHEHDVSTSYGKGKLYVTSHTLIIEIKKKGLIFHRFHNQMAGIEARGLRTIRVRWPEGSQMHEYDFKAWGAKDIVRRIKNRHDYTNNFSAEGGSRVMFDEKQRAEIRGERVKWAAKMLKDVEKRLSKEEKRVKKKQMPEVDPELAKDVESWRRMADDAGDAAVNRSMQVPERVPDHLVWHDAWLDGDFFYTFNPVWQDPNRKHAKVRDSEKDGKTGAFRIPLEYVRFFHGYPYVRGNAFATPDRFEVGWFIPSMTEEMLDVDMFVMANRPRHRFENEILFGERGAPAILGYTTDLEYLKNSKLGIHMSEIRWMSKHGRVPVDILRRAGIPDDFDRDVVGKRVADLRY